MDDRTFHKSWKYSKYTKVNRTTITLKLGYKKNTTGDIFGGCLVTTIYFVTQGNVYMHFHMSYCL